MEKINVDDAVGMVLCHDMTEIKDNKKTVPFRKGHILKPEDIEHLKSMGKFHIYVWDTEKGYIHENDGAEIMLNSAVGKGIAHSEIKEGKIELTADIDGMLRINKDALFKLNMLDNICFSTVHGNRVVKKGSKLAGMRVIPLVIDEKTMDEFKKISAENYPIIEVVPFEKTETGIVITGNEIKKGLKKDAFEPVLRKKSEECNSEVIKVIFSGDETKDIVDAIKECIDKGANLVAVTGGMSVDPDDTTPDAIKELGGELITYGTPVLPGAMFMLSYIGDVAVVGLPSCVMYRNASIYDLVVPRLLLGEKLKKEDFASMGYGGYCLACDVCKYPECAYGV